MWLYCQWLYSALNGLSRPASRDDEPHQRNDAADCAEEQSHLDVGGETGVPVAEVRDLDNGGRHRSERRHAADWKIELMATARRGGEKRAEENAGCEPHRAKDDEDHPPFTRVDASRIQDLDG